MNNLPPLAIGPPPAQRLLYYPDNKRTISPPPPSSPPPMNHGYDSYQVPHVMDDMNDSTSTVIEADVADTYAGGGGGNYSTSNGNGNVNGGSGGEHIGVHEYHSPSDVQRPNPPPMLLWPPPESSVGGDDDRQSVHSVMSPSSPRHPYANPLPLIDEGAATPGNMYRPHTFADGERNGAIGTAAAVPEPQQSPKTGKHSSRLFGRLRKGRRSAPEPNPPTAAFANLSVGGGGSGFGGGRGGGGGGATFRPAGPAAPGQPPEQVARVEEKPAALRVNVTAADVREATDLLRQLYRMELQIHDSRFELDNGDPTTGSSVLKERRASRLRADRLCDEIERRVQQWAYTQGASWDAKEKEHVAYSAKNVKALWNLGKNSRDQLGLAIRPLP